MGLRDRTINETKTIELCLCDIHQTSFLIFSPV